MNTPYTELNIECDRSYSKSPILGDLGGENLSHPQINLVLEGWLLTGRHGFFSTYEAFVHVIDSI
ncbi:hypothetical protein H6G01_24965 [Leptolyngbya sp. FACHB-17]|nr:hypothetical protein [Leptolyngbya sp. FACHB-17]